MSVTDNPHRLAARTQFALANQAATAAENATKDPALKNISKANTYYNAATGEILLLILERIERLPLQLAVTIQDHCPHVGHDVRRSGVGWDGKTSGAFR